MWALRPAYYDNDTPMDLRKKVVLQRDLEEQRESRQSETVFTPRDVTENYRDKWRQSPVLPVASLYPFVSEKYGGQCAVVNSEENRAQETRNGSKGALETAIRKLHHSRQQRQTTANRRIRRSRSANATLEKDVSKRSTRSSSCPNLSVIKESPPPVKSRSPIKPKSYFIQRSSGHLFDSDSNSNSIANSYHRTYENYRANSPILGGAKKRKSFVPVYGDRCLSPKKVYDDRTSPPKRYYDDRTSSPTGPPFLERPFSPRRRSPEPQPEEYYPRSEVLLRRQLQQQTTPAYLVHVYDYYQQLVQRLREQTSPGVRLPPPMSPNSVEDDMQPDSQRKRPCRALTGKHVRQGTGASLSTLLTLRQKIQERQKAKEHDVHSGFNGTSNKNMCPKKNKPQKLKPVMKNLLGKVHNC